MNKRRITYCLWLMLLLALILVSCIGENDVDCVQYAVSTKLVDASGNVLSDSAAKHRKAYLFVNGLYDNTLFSEADGSYFISMQKGSDVRLVVAGVSSTDSIDINSPKEGTPIDSLWMTLKHRSDNKTYELPYGMYYGIMNYATSSRAASYDVLPMYSQKSILHVVIENLRQDVGTYALTILGLRNALSYGGTVTGDSITYTPTVSFDSKGNLVSEEMTTLPTASGEGVTVSLMLGDRNYLTFSKASDGSLLTLKGGEDNVIVVDLGRIDLTITVMSWKEYSKEHIKI